jgi:beta-galactosidase
MASGGKDDWRAAAEVESYGYTWGSCRHGDEMWKQFHAVDLVRASCRGKRFWHAEAYGGPLWMASNVLNKPRDEGRIAVPEDIRYWNMVSFMAGATGLMFLRWRPLLDGPLFGAFGPYGLDGSRTPRSQMAGKVGKWVQASEQEKLWQSRPIKGEVGIIYVPETQFFTYAQQRNTSYYSRSMQGAYRGFFENNIQADWVHIRDIGDYRFLYLPFPVMLAQETADKLIAWVDEGGTLICEGCPGYFGDRGHVGMAQPNLGLDKLFGVKEIYVEFTPDILGDLTFNLGDSQVWGGIFLQAYECTTGTPVGWYEDGKVAAVDNAFGKGRARLIGTMPGSGYSSHPGSRSAAFFADLLKFAGKEQHVRCSDSRVKARLHDGTGGTYLWVANPKRQDISVCLELGESWGPFSSSHSLWGAEANVDERAITLTTGARNVAVMELT